MFFWTLDVLLPEEITHLIVIKLQKLSLEKCELLSVVLDESFTIAKTMLLVGDVVDEVQVKRLLFSI